MKVRKQKKKINKETVQQQKGHPLETEAPNNNDIQNNNDLKFYMNIHIKGYCIVNKAVLCVYR